MKLSTYYVQAPENVHKDGPLLVPAIKRQILKTDCKVESVSAIFVEE